jgi:hypothetical protein
MYIGISGLKCCYVFFLQIGTTKTFDMRRLTSHLGLRLAKYMRICNLKFNAYFHSTLQVLLV